MSLIKNPIFISLIVSSLVFVSFYYVYNFTNLVKKKNKNKKKIELSNFKDGINETIILSTAISGLITWFIASKYLDDSDNNDNTNNIDNTKEMIFKDFMTDNKSSANIQKNDNNVTKKISLKNDIQQKSINLINSGVNVPVSEIKIPNVLIDYN